jgi:hypothetical protein
VKDECIKDFFEKRIMLMHQKVTAGPHDVLRLLINVTVMALLSCCSLEHDILIKLCFYVHTTFEENFLKILNVYCATYYIKAWIGIAQSV